MFRCKARTNDCRASHQPPRAFVINESEIGQRYARMRSTKIWSNRPIFGQTHDQQQHSRHRRRSLEGPAQGWQAHRPPPNGYLADVVGGVGDQHLRQGVAYCREYLSIRFVGEFLIQ